MKPLVVDASAAQTLVRGEARAPEIRVQLRERIIGSAELLIPPLFWLEVVNVLALRYRYPPAAVIEAVYELEQQGLRTVEIGRPGVLAVVDAVAAAGITAYDASYLVLAESADAELLTADADLAAAAGERAIFVGEPRTIGESPGRYAVDSSWASWKGAAAYLAELRTSLSGAGGTSRPLLHPVELSDNF